MRPCAYPLRTCNYACRCPGNQKLPRPPPSTPWRAARPRCHRPPRTTLRGSCAMMHWANSLVDGVIARGHKIAYLHLIRQTGTAKSFPSTPRPPISRWKRSRGTCSNMDSVRRVFLHRDGLAHHVLMVTQSFPSFGSSVSTFCLHRCG